MGIEPAVGTHNWKHDGNEWTKVKKSKKEIRAKEGKKKVKN